MRRGWPPIHTYRLHSKGGSRHRQGLQPQSVNVHSQASASHAGASVSQSVHSQAGASQSGGLHTPRSLLDAANISEHATISPQTPRSASSVASVGTTRRGRVPSRVTSIKILPPGQTVSIDLEGGSSVGPYGQQFTTYLGVCNRVHCNIWQQDYMTLPPKKKETILRDLQDRMTQLMNPTPSEESDGTTHLPVLTPEEAFRQVFRRDRPGRIRCGGRGQTLRSWYGPSEGGSSSSTAYQRLLEEQSQQKSEISQHKSEIERMKKIIEDQE
ncbi:hypothetical protein Taro_008611 [Colocasia esculenta]|uniref:Uncharacterized protein n=1 Tax=Colocasia esculenta TaxID=4460 RepID=A0A843U1J1_COLES|nr:hypothetical protein [Colocasia esculenta]